MVVLVFFVCMMSLKIQLCGDACVWGMGMGGGPPPVLLLFYVRPLRKTIDVNRGSSFLRI